MEDIEYEGIKLLISYIDMLRKKYEKDEHFEACAELRDTISIFSNYILGYLTYSEIEQIVYSFCCADGNLIMTDYKNATVVWEIPEIGYKFVFTEVSNDELRRLKLLEGFKK